MEMEAWLVFGQLLWMPVLSRLLFRHNPPAAARATRRIKIFKHAKLLRGIILVAQTPRQILRGFQGCYYQLLSLVAGRWSLAPPVAVQRPGKYDICRV